MSGGDTTDYATEITFTVRDESYPIVNVSSELECRIDVLEVVHSPDEETLTEFFQVDCANPSHVVEAARACDRTTDVEILDAENDGAIVELVVSDCVAQSVARADAIFHSGHVESGDCRFSVFLPPSRDSSAVVDTIRNEHPAVMVASVRKRPVAEPFLTQQRFQQHLRSSLTDRQWQVLRLAHREGYFERPRETPQAELADQLGISQETVSQHLQAAQRRLLSAIFDEDLGE